MKYVYILKEIALKHPDTLKQVQLLSHTVLVLVTVISAFDVSLMVSLITVDSFGIPVGEVVS